jgi:phage gpG-like protein
MSNVKDIDKGWKRFVRDMGKIDGSYVKVGLPEGFTPGTASDPTGGQRDASEILIIGATHEFGTDKAGPKKNITIPERSWLRSSFDKNKERFNRALDRTYDQLLRRRLSVFEGLGRVGLLAANSAKKMIRDLRVPPLAPSTIKRKGSTNPLVDTGQLVQSITHEVKVKL